MEFSRQEYYKMQTIQCKGSTVSPFSQFSSVQSLCPVRLFATPWIAAHQASLSITNSQSSLRLTSIESVMPSSHLILCRPLLLLPSIPPSIRVFSNESTLHMRWPKYWSFSFSIIPFKEIPGLISFRMDWLDLLVVQGTLKSLLQHHNTPACSGQPHFPVCSTYHQLWPDQNKSWRTHGSFCILHQHVGQFFALESTLFAPALLNQTFGRSWKPWKMQQGHRV